MNFFRVEKARQINATLQPYLNGTAPLYTRQPRLPGQVAQDVTLADYMAQQAAYGRGSYGIGGRIGASLGGRAAGALGINRKFGRKVGGLAGGLGQSYLGMGGYTAAGAGDYDLDQSGAANSLISGSSVAVPTMQGGDEIGSVQISHREFLGNVTGSMVYENSSFQLNPGLVSTFPWLSQIAVNYEEYAFVQLMFTYVSLLSEATASGAVGSIIMSTNYNAGQDQFNNTNDMLNNVGTISARPTDGPIIHGVECDARKNVMDSLFVRVGSVPEGQDIKTYDMGKFQLATEGMPINDQLQGQLWVSYNIILRKPKLFTAAGKGILCDMYKGFADFSLVQPLGNPIYASPNNTIGTVFETNLIGGNQINIKIKFPQTVVQGFYEIELMWRNLTYNGTDAHGASQLIPVVVTSNCTVAVPQQQAKFVSNGTLLNQTLAYGVSTIKQGTRLMIKLGGNYAIPTFVELQYTLYQLAWLADDFQMSVTQINPTLVATSHNAVDSTWQAIPV